VAAHIGEEATLISGVISGEDFRVEFSTAVRTFGFFMLGLLALSILSGIVKALVIGGVDIIKGAMAMTIPPPSDPENNSKDAHQPHKAPRP